MKQTGNHNNDDKMEINLRSLRRSDRAIDCILSSASQVAIYNYVDNDWHKLNIEGSLFLVKRTSAPNYCYIINNRLHTENMIEPITGQEEIKVHESFLMLKNNKSQIFCIWFYENDELLSVSKKIKEIIVHTKNKQSQQTQPVQSSNGLQPSVDEAKERLKQCVSEPLEHKLARLGIVTSNAKPESSAPATAPIVSNTAPQSGENLLHTLLQQGTIKINKEFSPVKSQSTSRSVNLQDLFNGASQEQQREKSPVKPSSTEEVVLTPAMLKNLKSGKVGSLEENAESERSVNDLECPAIVGAAAARQPSPPLLSAQLLSGVTSKLYKPDAYKQQQQPVLSMEQLKQTLVYLLQNDADFLHHIHSTYVSVVQRS